MTEDINTNECADPTQNFTVELPCRMVERIERYAREKGTSVDNIMIEALDSLLDLKTLLNWPFVSFWFQRRFPDSTDGR